MTSSDEHRVRVSNPAELIASIPAMLGINPTASLVLLCFDTDHSRSRLTRLMRVDLPEPHQYNGLAAQLSQHASHDKPKSVIVVVIDHKGKATHADLIKAVAGALATIEVPVVEALWAEAIRQGSPWCSYDGVQRGTLPDPDRTELAAVKAVSGEPIFPCHNELIESLQSGADAATVRRRATLAQSLEHDAAAQRRTNPLDAANAACAAVDEAIRLAAMGTLPDTDEDIVRLVVALADPDVRDLATKSLGTDSARAVEGLWIMLTREAPPGWRADPAAMLAVWAYARGDGVLARAALDIAQQDQPTHMLAALLRQTIALGILPVAFVELIASIARSSDTSSP